MRWKEILDQLKYNDQRQYLIDKLTPYLTERRVSLIEQHLNNRTLYVTTVLEDMQKERNAGAIMRTCDCLGIQEVHVIEEKHRKRSTELISKGANKWVNRYDYNEDAANTIQCLQSLKESGYKIVATSPHKNGYTPENIPLNQKMAFCFGTEQDGISRIIEEQADEFVQIPMYGFSESLNVSVAAALVLNTVMNRLRESEIEWKMNEDQTLEKRLEWVVKSVRSGTEIAQEIITQEILK